jgi:hypothetical protein
MGPLAINLIRDLRTEMPSRFSEFDFPAVEDEEARTAGRNVSPPSSDAVM